MKRRAQGAGSEPPASTVARENARIKAVLQAQLALHSDAACEADELLAASEKDVLAVVYLNAVNLERSGAAAEQTATFEELYAGTGLLQGRAAERPASPPPTTATDGLVPPERGRRPTATRSRATIARPHAAFPSSRARRALLTEARDRARSSSTAPRRCRPSFERRRPDGAGYSEGLRIRW